MLLLGSMHAGAAWGWALVWGYEACAVWPLMAVGTTPVSGTPLPKPCVRAVLGGAVRATGAAGCSCVVRGWRDARVHGIRVGAWALQVISYSSE